MARSSLLLVAMLIATLLFSPYVAAQPLLCVFQGTVTARSGDSIPDGTVISAWIDGVKMAEKQLNNAWYDSLAIAGDYTGETVTFKVDKFEAHETATWNRGEIVGVDLTIDSWAFESDFYGSVVAHGNPVPDGTEVSAWVDSAKVNSTTTVNSRYHLTVQGNYTGKAVSFKVGGNYATPIGLWERGKDIETNLTVNVGPSVCGFYGSVTLDGANANDGIQVSAWIDGMLVGATTVANAKYTMRISGNYAGKTVVFKVNGLAATGSAVWARGENLSIDLTAVTAGIPLVTASLSTEKVGPGDEFTLTINVDPNGHGISGVEASILSVNTQVMEILSDKVTSGNLFGADLVEGTKEKTSTNEGESLKYAVVRKGETSVPTTAGTFATIGFRIKGGAKAGKYAIPNAITLTDENFNDLSFDPPTVSITVIRNTILGDLDGDDTVGSEDLAILVAAYGKSTGEEGFRAEADLNSNNKIDLGDLAILASNWGQRG